MEDPKAEDPKLDNLWHVRSGDLCRCAECRAARAMSPNLTTTEAKAVPEGSVAGYDAELRSLREQLSVAQSEVKRHLQEEESLREQLIKTFHQRDNLREGSTRLITQLAASQDLSRALTWALQQAYRASTIRSEDS